MDETYLRKWHRTMGIILAFFIFLQAASGAMMAFEYALNAQKLPGILTSIHYGGGFLGNIYRIILGLGVMGMAASGTLIFLKIRARTQKR
ncbi:MAG: hypothetical protein P8X65_01015 [Syntrophobacterales bacterium]